MIFSRTLTPLESAVGLHLQNKKLTPARAAEDSMGKQIRAWTAFDVDAFEEFTEDSLTKPVSIPDIAFGCL